MGHDLRRKPTHRVKHRLLRHQSSRIEPADQFAEVKLFLEPANALDAVLWCANNGYVVTDLFKGQALQTCLHFFIPFPRGRVHIRIARYHAPAQDVEVVHNALTRHRLRFHLGFSHIEGKE